MSILVRIDEMVTKCYTGGPQVIVPGDLWDTVLESSYLKATTQFKWSAGMEDEDILLVIKGPYPPKLKLKRKAIHA